MTLFHVLRHPLSWQCASRDIFMTYYLCEFKVYLYYEAGLNCYFTAVVVVYYELVIYFTITKVPDLF